MPKKISADDAKSNFGGLPEDIAAVERIEILKHGRFVAGELPGLWGEKHMIPPDLARAARMLKAPGNFDEE